MNQSAPEHADLIVLGSGVAGQLIAYQAREQGRSVALFETGPPGGTCPTRGCDAKKPFVNATYRVRQAAAMKDKGLAGDLAIDWPELVAFKRSFTEPIPQRTREDLSDAGVKLIEAKPRLIDAHTIEAKGRRYRAEQIAICTGQRPRSLDLPGAAHAIDSSAFLDLEALPDRMAFIGGGYIAMEFASIAAAAGCDVTIIERNTYPLGRFDRDAVRSLLAALQSMGISVLTNREVLAIDRDDQGLWVRMKDAEQPIAADIVVNASGRVPSIDGLELDRVGIACSSQGIEVDEHLRSTSHPHIWAAGDVADTGRAPLVPTAAQDGAVVAHNLFSDNLRSLSTTPVASVCFSYPPIAMAGLTEAQARERFGDNITVDAGEMARWKHFRQQGESHGFYKLVLCDRGILRGAHVFGVGAEEVINMFTIAIGQDCDESNFCEVTMAYPSVAHSLQNKFKKRNAEA